MWKELKGCKQPFLELLYPCIIRLFFNQSCFIEGGERRGTILGLMILCVGIYAEVERQKHKTLEGIFLAPAIILLLLGFTMFGVSFIGMVGSLRDNRTLLKTFFWVLLAIFLTELLLLFIEIIFENKVVFHSNIQEGIRHYYDDLDFKNILDFVQEKFSCCGGDEYRDWEVNQYHSCNSSGPLACGVPYTCCIRKVPGGVINTLCGYRTLDKERLELLNIIHVRGCIHAVGLWLKDNFEATFGIVCSLLLPQVCGGSYWSPLITNLAEFVMPHKPPLPLMMPENPYNSPAQVIKLFIIG
uniref:Tetraspanin-15 n=1 Tax=Melopsittacus undulatus TaxID=13146 RepID=A0A8V5GPL8_MELUD